MDKAERPQGMTNAKPRWARQPAPAESPPAGLPARLIAAAILAEVVGNGHALDDVWGSDANQVKLGALEPRDRALVRSILVVSLRRLGTIRRALGQFMERGLPKRSGSLEWVLVTMASQVLFLDVPDHAAVNLCVQAVRSDPKSAPFAALANAVARNLARERDALVATEPFADTPAWLAARWRQTYGEANAVAIAEAHRVAPTLDVTVKGDASTWAEALDGIVLATGSVRVNSHAAVPDLPGYGEGAWWVQDAAAALPAHLLRVEPGQRVADLCAAPGGKTAQLIAAGGQVVAVDRSAERLKRLAANLDRLGMTAETKVADAAGFVGEPFDAILLDAPCSATGTIRRHPDVAWTKRISDIASLAALQSRMLDRAVSLLRPGGLLVYSVCSLEPEEGEAQIAGLLRRNPDVSRVPVQTDEVGGWTHCVTPAGDLRTLPFFAVSQEPPLVGLDGFFAARLTRRA